MLYYRYIVISISRRHWRNNHGSINLGKSIAYDSVKWWWHHYLKLVRFLQQDVVNVLNTTVSLVEGLFCVKSFLSPATLQRFQPKIGQKYTNDTCTHWIHRLWFGVKDGGIVQENMAGFILRYYRLLVFSAVQRWPSLECAKALADEILWYVTTPKINRWRSAWTFCP